MRAKNLPKLQPGDLVAGRFRIIEPIGSGGFSVVYRAHQEDLNRFIALKILKPQASNDAKIVERFRREALYASHLSHPNTITLYDYGHTEGNLCFIAMEYLDGMDLSAVVQTHKPMDLKRVWRILVQCSRSLAEAHKLGLVHRDLKPENIFLSQHEGAQEIVKVLDFGVSKAVSGFGDASTLAPLTQEGTVFGTPLYMAPEQAMAEGISPAVDVYALGHIMFEMITGYAAYDGLTNAMDVMLKQINDPPLALPDPWDKTPFSDLITLCTQKDPEHRLASASVLLDHLLSDAFARWADPLEQRRRTMTNPRISTEEVVFTEHMEIDDLEAAYGDELDILNRAFDDVVAGKPRLVLIHGTPGSGRSNLLRGFIDRRVRFKPRATVLHRSFDSSLSISGMEYELSLLTGEKLEGTGVNEVRRILKKLYGEESEIEGEAMSSESRPLGSLSNIRESLFSQIGSPFKESANRRPVIWALENLERLDTLTLAFLERFFRDLRFHPAPILIVATVYSDDLQRRPGVAKYTQSLLEETPLNRQIFMRSQSREWPIVDEEDDYGLEPATMKLELEDLRTERIQTIADPESPFDVILGHLAQLGDEIPMDLWKLTHARILSTNLIGAVDTTLQQADKFGIISMNETLIRFTQSGYSEMLRDSFERLGGSKDSHLKIAELLEQFYPTLSHEQLKWIATQWVLGGQPENAIQRLTHAGDVAYSGLDLDAAREYFLQARQIANQYPELYSSKCSEGICLKLGEVHWALGEHGPAEDALQHAVMFAGEDEAILGQANKLLGALAHAGNKFSDALEFYNKSRQNFGAVGQVVGFTNATNEMAKSAIKVNRPDLAEKLCREALGLCTDSESLLLGRINRNLGVVLAFKARFSEAVQHLDIALQIFERLGCRDELIETLNEIGNSAYAAADYDRSIGYFRRAISLASEGHQNHQSRVGAARVLAATNQCEEVEDLLTSALTHASLVNDTTKMSEIHLLLGDRALTRNDIPAAVADYENAIALAEKIGLFRTVIAARIRLSYAAVFTNEEGEAFKFLNTAMEVARRVGNLDSELQIRAHLIYIQLLLHGFRDRDDTFISLLNEARDRKLLGAMTIACIFKADSEAARGGWAQSLEYLSQARLSAAQIRNYGSFVQIQRRIALIQKTTQSGSLKESVKGYSLGALIPPEVGKRKFEHFPNIKN